MITLYNSRMKKKKQKQKNKNETISINSSIIMDYCILLTSNLDTRYLNQVNLFKVRLSFFLGSD